MFDCELRLEPRDGLARMGRALGAAGVSVEGGGMSVVDGVGVAHFLVADAPTALAALRGAGLDVIACREVVTVRLRQDVPGQLGAFTGALTDAGVVVETLYSDHDHRLVVVADDPDAASRVAAAWAAP